MAPSKVPRGGHDDSKPETPASTAKDKASHPNHQSNGKSRRAAGSAASHAREVTNAPPPPANATASAAPQEHSSLKLQWPQFQREMLHSYRRAYRLNTPTAFSSDYRQWVLSRPGSIGLHSPTMARRKDFRRQSKDQLANNVRKHFNGLGVQENDIIVDFLHKVRCQGVAKSGVGAKRADSRQQPQ